MKESIPKKMGKELMSLLKKGQPIPPLKKMGYRDLKYYNRRIVQVSFLAPYFADLHFEKYWRLKKTFFTMSPTDFVKMIILFSYYEALHPERFFSERVEGEDILSTLLRKQAYTDYYRALDADYYKGLRQELHEKIRWSSGEETPEKVNLVLLSILAGRKTVMAHGMPRAGLEAIKSLVQYGPYSPEATEHFQVKKEAILHDFACYHALRDACYKLAPKDAPSWCPVGSSAGIDGFRIEDMAYDYRAGWQEMLENMEDWLPIHYHRCQEPAPQQLIQELKRDRERRPENMVEKEVVERRAANVPKEILSLANKLAWRHGPATITSESSGIHIYIADPELLKKDGRKEFTSKHLAVNAEKYLGIGRYNVDLYPTPENRDLYRRYRKWDREVPCAISMKTGKPWSVKALLNFSSLSDRYEEYRDVKATVFQTTVDKLLVQDEHGVWVPDWCGETIPLHELPKDHPAIQYLTSRGYDIALLELQFEACYCHKEAKESREKGLYYSKLAGGMKNTPQGRIVFSVRMNGSRVGYQSRYIDKWVENRHYFWTPSEMWRCVETRNPDGTLTPKFPPDENFPKGFAPHKYLNALGSKRNKLLMGFDAAVAYNRGRPMKDRFCVLVEGPLDAGKIGPPAIALLGKSISQEQAAEIRKNFSRILVARDNDEAGLQCLRKIYAELPNSIIVEVPVPESVKDVGDLSQEDAQKLIHTYEPSYR